MPLAELAESLLQIVGVHYLDDLHFGVYCHEERSPNGTMSDESGMSNTI